jgi:magnesium transporter
MNEVMKVLSIIATIMLPLTFITGIYGMNFVFLPAADHAFGFWGTIIFMALLAGFMLVLFWRKKWI